MSILQFRRFQNTDTATTQAVIEITDNILEELNKQNMVAGIYLDLSKTIDTLVCHKISLAKLEHYGVRGKALTWFQSYLIKQ